MHVVGVGMVWVGRRHVTGQGGGGGGLMGLQAEQLLDTMKLVRRVGPSAPLHPQGQRRVCPPRSPQYTFAHAAPGWHCYGENKASAALCCSLKAC